MTQKTLTAAGHTEDCLGSQDESCDEAASTHIDIFCEGCHDWFDEPKVLPNGTDIAWPATWSRDQAAKWRAEHNLVRPPVESAAGPHDTPDLVNATSTPGTGMLPEAGHASDQDMAPGG